MKEEDVTEALLGEDPHDKLAVAYNLVVDNKRIESESKSFFNYVSTFNTLLFTSNFPNYFWVFSNNKAKCRH